MSTFTVATQSQLTAALRNASSGDTIRLQSGSYDLKMSSSRQNDFEFNSNVTITSASKDRPASIKQMVLNEVSNVTLSDLVMDFERGGSVSGPLERDKKFFVQESSHVTFDNVTFQGEVRNGYGTGLGLRVKQSSDIEVLDSEFLNLENGLNFSNVSDVHISGNTTRRISNDAMSFGGIDGMVLEDNDFIDFHSNPNQRHKDAIQFRLTKTEPGTRDIVIQNNRIDNPESTHGILFGNAAFKSGDRDAFYRDITVSGNDLHTAHMMGIYVESAIGVDIRNNVLTHNGADGFNKLVNIPVITVSTNSRDVSILGNKVSNVQKAESSSWTVSGNDTSGATALAATKASATQATARVMAADVGTAAEKTVAATAVADAGQEHRATPAGLKQGGVTAPALDFDAGDQFVFTRFHDNTFRDAPGGNAVHDFFDGSAVRIDSVVDLAELVAHSPAISAEVNEARDTLTLAIDQGSDGVVKATFEGLGHAFLLVDPDLF
ncbi:right-handed parallel beta-helix repeat-containing protein [Amaricoccus sp.]|uniref:right-handed parallel beta-helix repeat-containing protein n=1 Tax=Amaricoccus sp. TaxID=1872485 RepID=UPI001B5981E2|nr:right-handed parallel beta-helix repeat-containing protein [Amaricoccus sp.]MBP7002235.1 right-handed parallel beta-helix repeat-containing protein [Amaricoccus sp.]